MRIPIEFRERTQPYSRRGSVYPGLRGNGLQYPGRRVRDPRWMDDPEELRQFPREESIEESVRADSGYEPAVDPEPDPVLSAVDAAEAERPRSGDDQGWRDRYVRLKADFENFKRHAGSDKARLTSAGKDAVLDDIFPIVDHLQRAIQAAENAGDDSGILMGLEMVYSEFLGVLEKHGVRKIEALGEPFDPRIHEAVAVREHPEHPEDTVVEEVRNGFMRGESLLRPAHVIVAQ
jgi:molecular chaperone GrpE